jgi:hypothetical protein
VVRTDSVEVYGAKYNVIEILGSKLKLLRWGNEEYRSHYYLSKKLKTHICQFFKVEDRLVGFYGWAPIVVSGTDQKISITYLYKTFNFRWFLNELQNMRHQEAVDCSKKITSFYVEKRQGRSIAIADSSTSSGSTDSNSTPSAAEVRKVPFVQHVLDLKERGILIGRDFNSFNEDTKGNTTQSTYYWTEEGNKLKSEIEFWLNSKEWFANKGIAWRRGALLMGKPGGGKSKLILEVARHFDIPVFILNISNMSDEEFTKSFYVHSHGIILIEDIDAVFQYRENILNKKMMNKQLLSFDTLLNTISAFEQTNGIFTVVTTNHPEVLDEALTRKGRLDLHLTLGPLCEDGRRFIAKNFLSDWPELIEDMVAKYPNAMAAEFENACIETAIDKYNETHLSITV